MENLKSEIACSQEEVIVVFFGMGASFIQRYDLLIYADMPRWELQKRMRLNKVTNIGSDNFNLDFHRKYKRAYFIDWHVLDRHKQSIIHQSHYILDTVIEDSPKMIPLEALTDGLEKAINQPFRVVPFFLTQVHGVVSG